MCKPLCVYRVKTWETRPLHLSWVWWYRSLRNYGQLSRRWEHSRTRDYKVERSPDRWVLRGSEVSCGFGSRRSGLKGARALHPWSIDRCGINGSGASTTRLLKSDLSFAPVSSSEFTVIQSSRIVLYWDQNRLKSSHDAFPRVRGWESFCAALLANAGESRASDR